MNIFEAELFWSWKTLRILWNQGFIIGIRSYTIEDDGGERRSTEGSWGRSGKSPTSPLESLAQVHKPELSGKSGKLAYLAAGVESRRTADEEVSRRLLPLHPVVGLGSPLVSRAESWDEQSMRETGHKVLCFCLSVSHYSGEQEWAGTHWHIHICLLPHLNRTTTQKQWPNFPSSVEFSCGFLCGLLWPWTTRENGFWERWVQPSPVDPVQNHQRSVPCFLDSLEEPLWDRLLVKCLEDFTSETIWARIFVGKLIWS